jgi:hypothetical protein
MSRLLKSRGYFMKSLGFVLLLGFISLGAIGGCNSNNNDNPTALTENDFAEDSALRAALTSANLNGADLSGAVRCDECICPDPSIGTCNGCASVDICTGPE